MTTTIAPSGLKGVVVADTAIGDVRGDEGFFHYRDHDATEVAAKRSFEATAHLLLNGRLPDPLSEGRFAADLGDLRTLAPQISRLVDELSAGQDQRRQDQRGQERPAHGPLSVLRAVLSVALDDRATLDISADDRRRSVMAAIGITPTVLAAVHRRSLGLAPIPADASRTHASDYIRMVTGEIPSPDTVRAVETYLSLTADHGFNASTFTARVITSTGADVGGALAGAVTALSGPLHGGAPGRVLDMIEAIGDPAGTEAWARAELAAGRRIMGFGHAVYRADDPRSDLLRSVAMGLGGELVDRAQQIEARMLPLLRDWKPGAVLVTNVEFYAAVVLALAGIPQEMFTPTFTVSRMVGWGAHVLEQAADNKIMRPSARYVGPVPPRPVPTS